MNETRRAGQALATFYKVPPERIVAIHDELDIAVRHAAGQARRRRQRPQRAAVDAVLARHRRLLPGPGRHRPAARSAGRRRLRALATTPPTERKDPAVPGRQGRRRRRVPGQPTASSGPSSSSTPDPVARVTRVTFDPGTPPAAAATDDHVLAAWLATVAGERLLEVRARGPRGPRAQGRRRPGRPRAADGAARRAPARRRGALRGGQGRQGHGWQRSRVWIVDPLDGTREFSEPPRDDWAVHVALWQDGDLVAGAVAQPALGETFNTGAPARRTRPHRARGPRIAVSRTRPPAFVRRRSPRSSTPSWCRWARPASR